MLIRSGGQTGADRAALDVARTLGLPIAGWCPAGGWAEDLTTPPGLLTLYPELVETPSADPAERTAWNVRDSGATLIICPGSLTFSPGTELTLRLAGDLGRPALVTDGASTTSIVNFVSHFGAGLVLNVAGPRESEQPGTYAAVTRVLETVLARLVQDPRIDGARRPSSSCQHSNPVTMETP